ncbi:transposase [Blautia schinkii]|nr:transposase [Blautia schinkii]
MKRLDNNAHSVFLLYYHLILVVKYRKKVLDDPISNRAREIFEHIAPNYHITLEVCLLSAGGALIEVIREYIETKGEKRHEHRIQVSALSQ